MSNTAANNREYYEKNKERIAKRKKSRYQNDPEYREAIKARSAEARRQKKQENAIKRRKGSLRDKRVDKEPRRVRVEFPDGSGSAVTGMYTLGQFAHQVGVSIATLRKWEARNVFPKALYRSPGGHRWYTEDQKDAFLAVYEYHKNNTIPWRISEEFKADIANAWNSLRFGIKEDGE